MPEFAANKPYHIWRSFAFLFLLVLAGLPVLAQQKVIKGRIKVSDQDKFLPLASVSLLREDSSLQVAVRSQRDGAFLLTGNIPAGSYWILISHPSYSPTYLPLVLGDSISNDLGLIYLSPKSDSLAPVIVIPPMLPRIKGDTLEFNTERLQMRVNSVVEDLMRRLPGLRIAADGTITYNGERIDKLLVDGQDIFSSDPTLITKNFDAGKIAKVQIIDRKSDQANFTGIDDGSRTKTINLVLKESARDSYFGKGEIGAGTEGLYNANALAASFHKKEQIVGLGMASNTGTLGFSSAAGGGVASIGVVNWQGDQMGASAGSGIPTYLAGGLHYANLWDGQKNHVEGNYEYGHVSTKPVTSSTTVQLLPDTVYTQDQKSFSVNSQNQHYFDGRYEWIPDTITQTLFTATGNQISGENQFQSSGNSSFNDRLINTIGRKIKSNVDHDNLSLGAMWRIRGKASAQRVLSIDANFRHSATTTNGYLYSLTKFYDSAGAIQPQDTIDERKLFSHKTNSGGGAVNYSFPVARSVGGGLSYTADYSRDEELQSSFNKSDGKYNSPIDSLGTNLISQTVNQHGVFNLYGKILRINYVLILDWLHYHYQQQDLLADSTLHFNYNSLSRRLILNYPLSGSTRLSLNYNASTQQPSIALLQTVKNNSDPLHLTLGNPDLKPALNQAIDIEFNRFKASSMTIHFHYDWASNAISNRTSTDSLGRQITQPKNVNGIKNINLTLNGGKKFGSWDFFYYTTDGLNRTVNYLNADLSKNDNYASLAGFRVSKYNADKYQLGYDVYYSYNYTSSSINPTPIHYWTQSYGLNLILYLIKGFEIGSNATYNWQQANGALGKAISVGLWNANVARNLMDNRLVIRLQAYNILNQNSGLSRSTSANVSSQNQTNVLGRYFILSLAYRFRDKGDK